MENAELMFNLWYLHDNTHIHSLRARCYVGFGDDHQKLALLRRFSRVDYLIAQPFPVPKRFHTIIITGNTQTKSPVVHVAGIEPLGGPVVLFDEALVALKCQLPEQAKLLIVSQPLICMTPLLANEHGKIQPKFTSRLGRYYEFQSDP